MKTNIAIKVPAKTTHGGTKAANINVEAQLRRTVASCLLWESEYYEDGVEIATRITDLASKVSPQVLAALAIEAREVFKLRHVPLLLLTVLVRTGKGTSLVGDTIGRVIQRADELLSEPEMRDMQVRLLRALGEKQS